MTSDFETIDKGFAVGFDSLRSVLARKATQARRHAVLTQTSFVLAVLKAGEHGARAQTSTSCAAYDSVLRTWILRAEELRYAVAEGRLAWESVTVTAPLETGATFVLTVN